MFDLKVGYLYKAALNSSSTGLLLCCKTRKGDVDLIWLTECDASALPPSSFEEVGKLDTKALDKALWSIYVDGE